MKWFDKVMTMEFSWAPLLSIVFCVAMGIFMFFAPGIKTPEEAPTKGAIVEYNCEKSDEYAKKWADMDSAGGVLCECQKDNAVRCWIFKNDMPFELLCTDKYCKMLKPAAP